MRRLLPVLAVLAASCARPLEFASHQDPAKIFSAEVAKSWRLDGDKDLSRVPVAVVSFIGAVDVQDEGVPLGAVINVTRVSRSPSEQPKGGARQAFLDGWIAPSDVLFGAPRETLKAGLRDSLPARVDETTLGGIPAKTYRRDYVHNNPIHMKAPVAMRLEDVVARTDGAYYIVEYRATAERFDALRPAFERFLKTFAFGPKS